MKATNTIALVGGLGVIGFALYRYYKKQVSILEELQYQVVTFKPVELKPSRLSFDITVKVFNPSNIQVRITEMLLDVYLNGTPMGKVNENKAIDLNPGQTTLVTFNFAIDASSVGKNLVDLITKTIATRKLVVDLKGFIRARSAFISTSMPFDYQTTVKI